MRLPILVILLSTAAAVSAAGTATIPMEFSLDISDVSVDDWMGRDVFSIPGGVVPFGEGEPALPGVPYALLIPQGSVISSVTVEVLSEESLEGFFAPAAVVCRPFSVPGPPVTDMIEYFTDDAVPSSPVGETTSGSMTGYRVGGFVLVPFMYHPLSGSVSVITSARITVECAPDPSVPLPDLSGEQLTMARGGLENIVMNPEMLSEWAPASTDRGSRGPVWVVIADSSLKGILQPLVDHRNITTGPAAFVGLDWIYSNYTGWDTQEQIRNYLKDAYLNQGLVYALIVGDYGETTRISSLKVGENTLNNVADLYYSDLDGTWDYDGDHLYGELSDIVEYLSDIYVGRFSSDVPTLIGNMVEKTIGYETTAPEGDWCKTAILIGAGLWPDSHYWGSFVCDSIDQRIPSSWTVEKLYEDTEGHPDNQIEMINAGASIVTPQGHGWSGGVAWYDFAPTDIISNGNYTQLTNIDMLPVFHSMACMSGELTNVGCIAERLMMAPWGGAIAVMFNSSYGWGTPPSTGPSEWLEIHFIEQLLVHGQSQVGVAQALAKDVLKFIPGVPLKDWVMQENNLLGDPALQFTGTQTGVESPPQAVTPVLALTVAPNPVHGSCNVSWSVPGNVTPRVEVYDIAGRSVATLTDGSRTPGTGSLSWDCKGSSGGSLPAGCYTLIIRAGNYTGSTRLLVLP